MSDDNPAANPWRPWEQDTPYVDFETRALIRRLTPQQRAVLSLLADHAGEGISTTTVAERLEATTTDVEAAVHRISNLAEALGYKPMIETLEDKISVPRQYVSVIRHGLQNTG